MSAAENRDEVRKGVEAALSRTAMQAKELAHQTGTGIVVMRDDKLVQETPPPDDHHEKTARSA